MDQRQQPRFPVRFHSSFSSVNLVQGDGTLVDLSLRGCGLVSSVALLPGTTVHLHIHMEGNKGLLTIGQAVVRWCRNSRAGLEFLSLQPDEWARLQDVVKELDRHPYERSDEDRPGAGT
ncbi:MAG: uncharacterized protein K0S58_2678 [Nitrospira sp.]|jgi:hypothetical protein|nr:uncharacterized protein [Nitrospira sp.]